MVRNGGAELFFLRRCGEQADWRRNHSVKEAEEPEGNLVAESYGSIIGGNEACPRALMIDGLSKIMLHHKK